MADGKKMLGSADNQRSRRHVNFRINRLGFTLEGPILLDAPRSETWRPKSEHASTRLTTLSVRPSIRDRLKNGLNELLNQRGADMADIPGGATGLSA